MSIMTRDFLKEAPVVPECSRRPLPTIRIDAPGVPGGALINVADYDLNREGYKVFSTGGDDLGDGAQEKGAAAASKASGASR